ncbi:phosphoribosylamine--glycine ligase [soil metagenome]
MGNTVIIVGNGAREHALAWKLTRSSNVSKLICAPGNPGTAAIAENAACQLSDVDCIVRLAIDRGADLVMIGPEAPLAAGLGDRLDMHNIAVCGPTAAAARIESSKTWAKELMARAGVPTAHSAIVRDQTDINDALARFQSPYVIKADGLAAGKGVVIAENEAEATSAIESFLSGSLGGIGGQSVLVEQYLEGQEVSLLALTDGKTIVPLLPACDYKRVFDGDVGPNTGGMGAYAPVPVMTSSTVENITTTILEPVIASMASAGSPMRGVLYAGLMMTSDRPMVLEFNARFGDPETQVVLPLLESDLFDLLLATATGTLDQIPEPSWSTDCAVGVVVASGGYPGSYRTGLPISGLGDDSSQSLLFHAGTAFGNDRTIVTGGGRVLTAVGLGESFEIAAERACSRANAVAFDRAFFRNDIASREFGGS